MEAVVLAAGRGMRMRPLTDQVPKPLLLAGGRPLIEYHLQGLAEAGITRIVINHAHLGEKIRQHLGNGSKLGMEIYYSDESQGVLETGGGIARAMDLINSDPFVVTNGDIWIDFPYHQIPTHIPGLAWLLLVDNPDHNPNGDFCLSEQRITPLKSDCAGATLTFSGIGVYRRALFSERPPGSAFPLAPLLESAAASGQVTGRHYTGRWLDIGTPERLAQLNTWLDSSDP